MNEGGKRIVVGVDGSPSSHQTLRRAARQAKLTGASLQVIICWEYPTSFGWAPPYPTDFDPGRDAKCTLEVTVAEVLGDDPVIEHPIELSVMPAMPTVTATVMSRRHAADLNATWSPTSYP